MFSDLRRHCNKLPAYLYLSHYRPVSIVCVVSRSFAASFVSNLTALTSPKIANGPKTVLVLILLASGCVFLSCFSPPLSNSRKHRWFELSDSHPSPRSFGRCQSCSLASSSWPHPIAPCFHQLPTYCLPKLAQKPSDGSQSS